MAGEVWGLPSVFANLLWDKMHFKWEPSRLPYLHIYTNDPET